MSLVDIAIAAGAIAVAPFGKPAAIKRGCLIWVDAEGRVIINNCVKKPQPCEEAAKAVAGGGEHGVDGVAAGMGEVIAAHVVVLLEVADDGLDGGPPFEFALDLRREAALLAAGEWWCVVAAIAGISDAAIEDVADERLHLRNDRAERVPVIGKCCGMGDELPAGGMFHRGDDAHLDPELVRPVRFALADALDLWRVQGIDLAPRWRRSCSSTRRGSAGA